MSLSIRPAGTADADQVARLFDLYRSYYRQPPDLELARSFIIARMQRRESMILLAEQGHDAVGFTQLYPSFSSVGAARLWILNDLYVQADARRGGVAAALLRAAADFARADGAVRLELETGHDNVAAQALYRHLGWSQYSDTLRFRLNLQ